MRLVSIDVILYELDRDIFYVQLGYNIFKEEITL